MDILRKGNSVAIFIFFGVLLNGHCEFMKIGKCLYGKGITCPDPRIKFYLFTEKNQKNPQEITPNETKILESHFNRQSINKVIIHGFNSNMNLTSLLEIKNAYLKSGTFNVWMIDWSTLAAGPWQCYPRVVKNLDYVGTCIAQMLNTILNATSVPKDKAFHLIGFSLGAHLAAYTANHLRPYKLPRITGLDPAAPRFRFVSEEKKLDRTDANFVDVLHTAVPLTGKTKPCGHIDFYMNGGVHQPGCWEGKILKYCKCNHYRAPAYFAESIISKDGFWGKLCETYIHCIFKQWKEETSTVLMGENVDHNLTGTYGIHTAAESPYAIGRNYVVLAKDEFLAQRLSSPNGTEIISYPRNTFVGDLINDAYFPEFESEPGQTLLDDMLVNSLFTAEGEKSCDI